MAETKKKASRKTSAAVAVAQVGEVTLEQIVSATLDQTKGFLYTLPAVHTPLAEAGLVEINEALTNEAGEIATRATEKGVQQVSTATDTAVPVASSGGFKIESNVALPPVTGRGRAATGSKYPFDQLELNQSFFVAASEKMPDPAKGLASTISSANARFAEVIEGETKTNRKGNVVPATRQTRQFVLRSVEENGVKGARVWRVL